jgi:precorrin-3B synthase
LPGRFLFALDDGRGDVAGMRPDAGVLGLPGDRVALLLAGLDTGLRMPVRAAVTALLEVASAFLRRRPDQRTWRLAELPAGPLSLLEDLAPIPGATHTTPVDVPATGGAGPVGRIEQTDGRVALAVSVPLGELTSDRCRVLAETAGDEVVLMPGRSVLLPDLAPARAGTAAPGLRASGLILDPASPELGVSACTGRPGCAKALADVRSEASRAPLAPPAALAPPASERSGMGRGLPVHWSGCARRCGRPAGPVVDVVADLEGYQVYRDDQPVVAGADGASAHAAATRARYSR